jgi:hypothetical protein
MNTVVKSAIAGALALGATGAYAAGIGLPSTNSSDVYLYVDALTSTGSSAGVYALDTGISLSSLLPGPYVPNAQNSQAFSASAKSLGPSTLLTNFINGHAGDTIEWTVEGGQFNLHATSSSASKADSTNTQRPGDALVAFSSKALQGITPAGVKPPLASTAVAGNLANTLNSFDEDLGTSGGIKGLTSASETLGTETAGAQSKFGFFGGNDLSVAGSGAVDFFGFTGNGSSGTVQSYLLGTASLSSTGQLVIAGNAPVSAVPLPAAVWLFGSGLLGLVGVSRRRKTA